VNTYGSCNVIDGQQDQVAQMYGQRLNRLSRDFAEELTLLLNHEEARLAAFPKSPP
jgi:hypothetical protein